MTSYKPVTQPGRDALERCPRVGHGGLQPRRFRLSFPSDRRRGSDRPLGMTLLVEA